MRDELEAISHANIINSLTGRCTAVAALLLCRQCRLLCCLLTVAHSTILGCMRRIDAVVIIARPFVRHFRHSLHSQYTYGIRRSCETWLVTPFVILCVCVCVYTMHYNYIITYRLLRATYNDFHFLFEKYEIDAVTMTHKSHYHLTLSRRGAKIANCILDLLSRLPVRSTVSYI